MTDVICPTCGRPNSRDREFCDLCGNPLDGALPVEPQGSSLRDDLFTSEDQDGIDESARLDSFFDEPLADTGGTPGGGSPLEEPPAGSDRLDDYLPVDPQDSPIPPEENGSSRLDDYLSPDEEKDQIPADQVRMPPDSDDESSRLEDYFSAQEPIPSDQEELPPAETDDQASRLDDFFADDPFRSPDPFLEGDSADAEETDQEDEFDPFKLPPEELNLTAELLETTGESAQPESSPLETWDLFSEEFSIPADDEPETAPDSDDSSGFDAFDLEPAAGEDQEQEPAGVEEWGGGEWEIPDPASTQELTSPEGEEDAPIGETSPGEWEFLDPGPGVDEPISGEPEGSAPADEKSSGEFDYLDPGRDMGPPAGESEEGEPAGEWDFLDPGPPDDQPVPEDQLAGPAPGEDASGEFDWLDPSPETDLEDAADEPEMEVQKVEEDSGWLDMLQSPEDREAAQEEIQEPEKPQTDWLEKIKRLNKSSDLVDEDSSFPDWLAVSEQAPEGPAESPQEEKPPASEVPEWLKVEDDESLSEFLRKKDLTNEEYKPEISQVSRRGAEGGDDDAPADGLSDSQQIKFPSWADEENRKKEAKERSASRGKDPGAEPFQVEEDYFDDLFSEELPDWLTAAASEGIPQQMTEELTQGELPGWVEAMRPVVESADATGLADDEEYIENYGPLAGIPSVLPAEAEIGIDLEGADKKPLDLLASPSHQDFVNLLKKIIGDENKGKTILKPAPLATQRVLRWLISIVLLVTTAGTIIFGPAAETTPPSAAQIQGTGYAALHGQIESLSDGQPVLIAFDYQPASAGELHTAAAGVVDHLMERGTFLSFISTQPTGPALAEHFLDRTQSEHGYLHTQKYINLGYLPGESAGLLSFMIAPKQIIPLAFDGSNAWDSPPLLGVDAINDFRMILVITDDPNVAKSWIEQIGTRLEDTPLTMVVSAQVEPLIQPYFRSSPQPLNGYVAGVIDSMNYEQLTGQPNRASQIWLPFNIAIVISVGIIFISGLANGVLSLFSRRKTLLLGGEQ